ncbi:MAG: MopE-related protein [Myxococcota bacterium]
MSDSCTPGGPTGDDADCNGVDDDCDGATDESFVGVPTSCGVGVCASTGMTTCTAGVVGDTCTAGAPTGNDADCDSTDNDCDGSTDESFVSDPTSCGVGVCASTGMTTCSAGVIGDTCLAGSPTGGDADCDGTDNDCDGSTDESFVSGPTSCGVGVCASTGMTTCTAGVVGDTCTAGAPTGDDADCDSTDNDCDGSTDESFVSDPTSCGVGVCASTGMTTCSAGVIGDTCLAGSPNAWRGRYVRRRGQRLRRRYGRGLRGRSDLVRDWRLRFHRHDDLCGWRHRRHLRGGCSDGRRRGL